MRKSYLTVPVQSILLVLLLLCFNLEIHLQVLWEIIMFEELAAALGGYVLYVEATVGLSWSLSVKQKTTEQLDLT